MEWGCCPEEDEGPVGQPKKPDDDHSVILARKPWTRSELGAFKCTSIISMSMTMIDDT